MAAQLLKLCMDLLTGKGKYRYCLRVGTFGTESAVRKRGGSRNLPYLNAANSVTGHVCVNSNEAADEEDNEEVKS